MSNVKSVTEAFELTHDEVNYARFTSILRKRILMDLSQDLKTVYEKRVGPTYEKANGKTPNGREIRKAMLKEPIFQGWSVLRHTAQQMTWWSVQPAIERQLPEMIDIARDVAE